MLFLLFVRLDSFISLSFLSITCLITLFTESVGSCNKTDSLISVEFECFPRHRFDTSAFWHPHDRHESLSIHSERCSLIEATEGRPFRHWDPDGSWRPFLLRDSAIYRGSSRLDRSKMFRISGPVCLFVLVCHQSVFVVILLASASLYYVTVRPASLQSVGATSGGDSRSHARPRLRNSSRLFISCDYR